MSFKSQLTNFLLNYRKLIILGIGNEVKSDDGVGSYIIKKLKKEKLEHENLMFIDAKTVPENFTGKIRKENPSHLIIIDACLMDKKEGCIEIVDENDFSNIGISTHSMSLAYFVKYLKKESDINIVFVGIEPQTMDFGENLTNNVEKSADEFIGLLKGIL